MSGATYNQWMADTLAELGLRMQAPGGTIPMPTQPNRPLMPVPVGKGGSKMPLAGVLRSMAVGSQAERASIDPAKQGRINEMHSDGLAAPVQIASQGGRTLSGNFFSAEGHNLKQNAGAPDLTRPLVLLLTGSGGSAEDQGLETSEFYTKSGASVLSANYGGFGGSTATAPTEENLYQDAHAMLQHAVDLGYDTDNIVIHGYSLGGAIAGKLKEEVEGGGDKFRGLVLDRPMVSMAAGVQTRLPGFLSKTGLAQGAAQYSRKALGTFSARSAIQGSANTDTRMVISSDQGRFADKADDLRQQLQAQNRPATTTGSRTNQGHFAHGAMLTQNAADLKQLVEQDRAGNPQNVQSGEPESAHKLTSEMLDQMQKAAQDVSDGATGISADIALWATRGVPPAQVVRQYVTMAQGHLEKGLDIVRNVPAMFGVWQQQAEQAVGSLQDSMATLEEMLAAAGAAQNSPAALVDAVEERCTDAMAALTAPGGPSANNAALEKEVLDAEAACRKLRGAVLDQQFLSDLTDEVARIQLRRSAAALRARRGRGAVRNRAMLRPQQGGQGSSTAQTGAQGNAI